MVRMVLSAGRDARLYGRQDARRYGTAALFGGLWLACFGFVRGWFDFEWLKHALQWVQKHF